jgi:hypothetical protein
MIISRHAPNLAPPWPAPWFTNGLLAAARQTQAGSKRVCPLSLRATSYMKLRLCRADSTQAGS